VVIYRLFGRGRGALGPLLIILIGIAGPVSLALATRRRRLTEEAASA
jgi:hypothetical protein